MPSTVGKLIAYHPQAVPCDLIADERRRLISSKYSVQAIYGAHRKGRKVGYELWFIDSDETFFTPERKGEHCQSLRPLRSLL